ncbi:MAG: hypothetical protein WCR58_10150 [Bacteroidales bacterium]|nr:hypothetical protein [Bacteroidales bacterium]MDD3702155.1 hypothetical protein [Bacteroidales bacterium]MDY0369958.1 hypothetical protein [Bacteroidales bacterium]
MGLILMAASLRTACSQEQKVYDELSKYSKWSIVAGPVLYDKAYLTPQYGEYTFENIPILGFNAGFEYDFYPDAKWSFITGLYFAYEPVYNLKFTLKEIDIYDHFEEDYSDHINMYANPSFSSPVLLRLNIQSGNRTFNSFLIGFKAMFFPRGEAEMTYAMSSLELSERREVFGLKLESPKNNFQGSFVIGTGFSYALEKVLLKANLIYVMNFQHTIYGEYQFANLFTSPDTRGYYDLTGNYLGLLISIGLKKTYRL